MQLVGTEPYLKFIESLRKTPRYWIIDRNNCIRFVNPPVTMGKFSEIVILDCPLTKLGNDLKALDKKKRIMTFALGEVNKTTILLGFPSRDDHEIILPAIDLINPNNPLHDPETLQIRRDILEATGAVQEKAPA